MYPENWLIGYFSTGQSNFGEKDLETVIGLFL
jgi:hypothetical protein